jgi:hypothetical protein
LADVAELLGEFQQYDLGADDLLFSRHGVLQCAEAGRFATPTAAPSLGLRFAAGTGHLRLSFGQCSSRHGHAREYAVNLGGHDEIVLMQSLDFLGLQRDRGIAPTEADIRMMAFSFREFTNLLDKGKRLPEIAKPETPLDAVSFL